MNPKPSIKATDNSISHKHLPVSLVICSRNRPQMLADTIASVLDGAQLPAELVVVDQSDEPHPTLSSAKVMAGCSVQYRHVQSRGVASARNTAIESAAHEICVLIDDDMFVASDWLGALVQALVDAEPQSVVTGQVREHAEDLTGFAPSLKTDSEAVIYQGLIDRDVLFTGNMAIYRTTVEALGWFDERLGAGARFPAAYDNDFGYRLLKAGYRICYIPQAIVYHRAWRGKEGYYPLRWNYGRGQGGMLAKHMNLLNDRHMIKRALQLIVQRASRVPFRLRRQRREAYGDLIYLAGLISGIVNWWLTEPPGTSRGQDRSAATFLRSAANGESECK